mgnify:CR=1 FL=1
MEDRVYNSLANTLANYLEDRKEPMDIPFLIKGPTVYTKRDIINAIRTQTDEGHLFVFDLI